jgi:glycosyltransferase involved in cell wall biosynthesis
MVSYSDYKTDTRVRRYAEVLAKMNNRVDLISLEGPEAIKSNTYSCEGDLMTIQKRKGNEKYPFSYLLKVLYFFLKGSIMIFFRHIKYRYKIIHIHNVPDFLIFMGIIPKIFGSKMILDIHDILPEFYCEKFNKSMDSLIIKFILLIEKISVRFADHVIVANDIWRKKIINRTGIPSSKCTTLLNYPDLKYFDEPRSTNEKRSFIIVYPGTVSKLHGIDIAIKSIALVKEELPNVQLHLYTNNKNLNYVKYLNNLIKKLNLDRNIFFFKEVCIEELGIILAKATMGIVPKRGIGFAGEAFSTKIPEFMAAGLPVVASKTKIDEYYFNDSMILFFESENHEDLAKCIIELYKDKKKQNILVKNAKQFVIENNWDNKKQIYLNIVESIVNSK